MFKIGLTGVLSFGVFLYTIPISIICNFYDPYIWIPKPEYCNSSYFFIAWISGIYSILIFAFLSWRLNKMKDF